MRLACVQCASQKQRVEAFFEKHRPLLKRRDALIAQDETLRKQASPNTDKQIDTFDELRKCFDTLMGILTKSNVYATLACEMLQCMKCKPACKATLARLKKLFVHILTDAYMYKLDKTNKVNKTKLIQLLEQLCTCIDVPLQPMQAQAREVVKEMERFKKEFATKKRV